MRRLAESAFELSAEMGAREAGGTSKVVDTKRLCVARIDQVPGPQEVALRRNNAHRRQFALIGGRGISDRPPRSGSMLDVRFRSVVRVAFDVEVGQDSVEPAG